MPRSSRKSGNTLPMSHSAHYWSRGCIHIYLRFIISTSSNASIIDKTHTIPLPTSIQVEPLIRIPRWRYCLCFTVYLRSSVSVLIHRWQTLPEQNCWYALLLRCSSWLTGYVQTDTSSNTSRCAYEVSPVKDLSITLYINTGLHSLSITNEHIPICHGPSR